MNQPTPTWPSVQETSLVALLGVGVLAVNLLTAPRIPLPWMDEILFVDPATNLLVGRGFTSTAWFLQQSTDFWASYPPLYSFLLCLWMKVFGFGVGPVRSLDYMLVLLAVLIVWIAVLRLDLVSTARHRTMLVALLLLGYGPTFCYRAARGPDCLGMFLFSALLCSSMVSMAWKRRLAMVLLGALLTTTGLQLVVYAGTLGTLLVLYLGRRALPEVVCAGAGLVLGAVALCVLYTLHGVLNDFVVAMTNPGTFTFRRDGLARIGGVYKDPSFILLLGLALVFAMRVGFRRLVQARFALGFGLVTAFVVPTAIAAIGHYPAYYSWMAFAPLSICVCATLSGPTVTRSPWATLVVRGLLAGTCLAGLPLILALTAPTWAERDPSRVERIVSAHVRHDDWVYTDFQTYYAARQQAATVFLPPHLKRMPHEERERLTVLIVSPDKIAQLTRTLGGQWQTVADGIAPSTSPANGVPGVWGVQYNFRIYRRAGGGIAPAP